MKKHVYHYETNRKLDGSPTKELISQSLATDTGAVSAYLEAGKWHYAPPPLIDFLRRRGEKVKIVYVK